jgi:hypothetical protein
LAFWDVRVGLSFFVFGIRATGSLHRRATDPDELNKRPFEEMRRERKMLLYTRAFNATPTE